MQRERLRDALLGAPWDGQRPGATGVMQNRKMSLRDRIVDLIAGGARATGASPTMANRMRNEAGMVVDFVPGVGDAIGVDETKRAFSQGRYGDAALNGVTTAVGAVPGGGDLAAGIVKAIFGGIGAKTANRALLQTAEEMAAKGADKRSIWDATGWFKGADDKWRFEIDDSASQFKGVNPEPQSTPIRAAMSHPDLYGAYPDLVPATVHESTMGRETQGRYLGYEPGNEQIALSWSAKDPRSTLLHEIQHAIQAREGFAKGDGGFMFNPNTPAWDIYQERLAKIRTPMPEEQFYSSGLGGPEFPYSEYLKQHKAALKNQGQMLDRIAQEEAVKEAYRRAGGEVESRNVQTRMTMTPEQRRATPPWETQDVPYDQQIVRYRR